MKSVKIVIATLIAVALMVTPIALYSVEDQESDAAVDFAELSSIIGNIDFEKLMSVDYTTASDLTDEAVNSDQTVTMGNYKFMNKNYVLGDKVTITVEEYASLTICPNQSFGLSSTGTGCLFLEEGSHIYLVTNSNAPDTYTKSNIISDYEIEEDTAIFFTGSMGFTFSPLEFTLFANAGTKILDSNTAEANTLMEFPSANNLKLKITKGDINASKTSLTFAVTATLDVKAPSPQGDALVKGAVGYTLKYDDQVSAAQRDVTINLQGKDNQVSIDVGDYKGTIKDSEDITIKGTVYNDPNKDPKTSMEGSLVLEVITDNMEDHQTKDPSGKVLSTTTVKNASAKYELEFKNEKIIGEMNVKIGDYDLTEFDDDGDVTITLDDLKFFGRYEGTFSFEDISGGSPLAASVALPGQIAASKPSLAEQYMKGIRPTMSTGEIKEYASEFFLGQMDKSMGLDQSGVTTTSLEAEFSIGEADFGTTVISGLDLDLEISDSVGFAASASVDKLIYEKVDKTNKETTKFVLGSSEVTLSTSENGKSMFDCDFTASAEMKTYSPESVLMTSPYMKNLKGKVTIGTSTKISSITVDEVAIITYGVGVTAKNLEYDPDWNAFLIDKVNVSGDYYGPAAVRSVDGNYKNVMLSFDSGLSLSAESVDLRVYAINGDYVDFTRSYDSSKKVIENTYDADGQIYLADLFGDPVLFDGLMAIPITGAVNAKEVNYVEGGILVPGSYTTVSPISGMTVNPGITVDGKTVTTRINGSAFEIAAPAELYATTTMFGGYPTGNNGKININGVTTSFEFTGAALGVEVDEKGAVSYSLMALPGYKLSKSDMATSGITISSCNDKTADITITSGGTISCKAIPIKYDIKLDGKTVKEDVAYGTSVTVEGIPAGTFYIVDEKGNIVGDVDGTTWSVGPYYFTDDLDAKTVDGTAVAEVKTTDMNTVNSSAVKFTVPAGGQSLKFTLASDVRFDLSGMTPGAEIELIAQKTSYDGHDGFLIKANGGNYNSTYTIFVPASGTGKKLMHVDEYGRVSERQSETVKIGEQYYLKTTTNDFSIFYEATDDSPVLPSGGNGPNWLLIGIGIAAGVLVVAGVTIFLIKRK